VADLFVFRSTHPDALAAWHTAHEQAQEIGRQRRTLLDDMGFAGRPALINEGRMLGVEHRDEHGPIPEGWRRDRHTDGAIVPHRRTKTGAAIGKKLDALTMPDVRRKLPGGMPEMAWDLGNGRVYYPGISLHGDALYVRWGGDPEKSERSVRLDPGVWERLKLSEYYAVLEAEAQTGGAS
jgi:hypothetical protein